jgi:hypothetical protein
MGGGCACLALAQPIERGRHMPEKRSSTIPALRIEPSLEMSLMRSAAADGRSLADYCRRVLWQHEFGYARIVAEDGSPVSDFGALHCDAAGRGMS